MFNHLNHILKKHPIILIILFALLLRMSFFLVLHPWTWTPQDFINNSYNDDRGYESLARYIVEGFGYLELDSAKIDYRIWQADIMGYRTAGYPLFVSFFFYIFGFIYWPVFLTQILLDLLVVLLIHLIACKIYPRHGVPFVAPLLYSLDLMPVFYCLTIRTDAPGTFLFTLFIYALMIAKERGWRTGDFAALGLILGVATHVRLILLYFSPFIGLYFLFDRAFIMRGSKHILKSMVILYLVFFLILSPWVYRNMRVYGSPALSSLPGIHMCMYHAGYLKYKIDDVGFYDAFHEICDESVVGVDNPFDESSLWVGKSVEYLSQHPAEYMANHIESVLLLFTRPMTYDSRFHDTFKDEFAAVGVSAKTFKSVTSFFVGAKILLEAIFLLPGLVILLWDRRRRFHSMVFLITLLFFANLVGVVSWHAGGRLKLPILPLIVISSSVGICSLAWKIKSLKIVRIESVGGAKTIHVCCPWKTRRRPRQK